jgi:hypothetical protein
VQKKRTKRELGDDEPEMFFSTFAALRSWYR